MQSAQVNSWCRVGLSGSSSVMGRSAGERWKRLWKESDVGVEGLDEGGLRAMIVLLLKQIHLQYEVVVERATTVDWGRQDSRQRMERIINDRREEWSIVWAVRRDRRALYLISSSP